MKKIFLLLILGIFMLSFTSAIWDYRQNYSILDDYPTLLEDFVFAFPISIDYATGMQDDFGDIRFTYSLTYTEDEWLLPYNISSINSGVTAYFNVDFEWPPATSQEYIQIYVYYGNDEVETTAIDGVLSNPYYPEIFPFSYDGTDSWNDWIGYFFPPTLNVTSPNGTYDYLREGTVLNLTAKANSGMLNNLDYCWYTYSNLSNKISFNCTDNQFNTTTFNYIHGINSVIFYANDTIGDIASFQANFSYKILENSLTANEQTIDGSTETFILNFTKFGAGQISTVDLYYDGVVKRASNSINGNDVISTVNLIIPDVENDTNQTYYFKITYTDGSIINSSSSVQLVKNLAIDDCSVYTNKIFNLSLIDEETQVFLTTNTSIAYTLLIYPINNVTPILQKYTKVSANKTSICLNLPLNESTFDVDLIIKYSADEHAIEYYNIQKFRMTNETIPQNITLYDLSSTDSVEFQINYKDSSYLPVEDALITFNRQYVSEGVFKTVEIPKTDSTGQTVAHLDEKDVLYNIVVTKDGVVLATYENMIAFCEDIVTGLCRINLIQSSEAIEFYDYDGAIPISVLESYNETSRVFSYSFTTKDGSVKTVQLIIKQTDLLSTTVVCNETLTTASGTITCTIPVSVGNSTLTVYTYVDEELILFGNLDLKEKIPYGKYGYFVFFLFLIAIILMFSGSKSGMVFGVMIGFLCAGILQLQNGGVGGIFASVIWLIVAGGILLYTLNKRATT